MLKLAPLRTGWMNVLCALCPAWQQLSSVVATSCWLFLSSDFSFSVSFRFCCLFAMFCSLFCCCGRVHFMFLLFCFDSNCNPFSAMLKCTDEDVEIVCDHYSDSGRGSGNYSCIQIRRPNHIIVSKIHGKFVRRECEWEDVVGRRLGAPPWLLAFKRNYY